MTTAEAIQPLAAADLRPEFDVRASSARTQGGDGQRLLGQKRALDAIEFGAGIWRPGFNIFVIGSRGTGRRTAAKHIAQQGVKSAKPTNDWVYVHNFQQSWRPRAIRLPMGKAAPFAAAVQDMMTGLRTAIPALFETDEYQDHRREIDQAAEEKQTEKMQRIRDKANAKGIEIMRTPMGFALAAMKDGAIVQSEAFNALPEDERKKIQADIEALQDDLSATLQELPEIEEHRQEQIRALNGKMAATVIDSAITAVRLKFDQINAIADRLTEMRADLLERVEIFVMRPVVGGEPEAESPFPEASQPIREDPRFRRYLINPVITRTDEEDGAAAPVIDEDHPTLSRLVGHVEHRSRMGALETDFLMIRPGALHRANGGFLILDALELLRQPLAWDALKRALRSSRIEITSLAEEMSLISTVSLEPEVIPLDLKVILIGDRMLYYLLVQFDPELGDLFKVQADFDDEFAWTAETLPDFTDMIGEVAARDGLLPLTQDASAAVLFEAARNAGDAERLSLRIGRLKDLLHEADHRARSAGRDQIDADILALSVQERERRADRLKERSHEMITRDIRMIDTAGSIVGQINGLSVLQIGETVFGQPNRITARVRMGAGKLIDIERETKLGGPIHSKGVLILSSYLASTYALDAPMSLWASLVFEQSYGGVDGDSASSAELYALLSALSDRPISQSFAVTGSVNQMGEVQAIGGVNEKIEGFFDICAARGLDGGQGVLIPAANQRHLVLRDRVVDAVRAGKFSIYPISTIAQGIEVLTGVPAGVRDAAQKFPSDSINGLVEVKLQSFASARRLFGQSSEDDSAAEVSDG